MNNEKKPFLTYFGKSLAWVAGVGLFGLSPFLMLQFINILSKEDIASMEMDHLLQGRFILFVACAATGSVVFDFITSKIKMKGWLPAFAVYITPFCILAYLFVKYLLLYVQLPDHGYGPGSLSTRLCLLFSTLYCIFGKTLYYIKKDHAGPGYKI